MKATIYTKDNCPFCVNAKNLLDLKKIGYQEQKIGRELSREEFLEKFPNARTVPQIYMQLPDNETIYIGGYTELVKYFDGQTS